MIGTLIVGIAQTFREIGTAIGKEEFNHDHEDVFSMGFINAVIGVAIFISIAIATKEFTLVAGSYPTLALRFFLEIALTFITVKAIVHASRSAFTFLRALTPPLLLVIDIIIGYTLSLQNIVGVLIISFGLLFLYARHALEKDGQWWVITSALIAVITTSLYKYNITLYNSVAAEQTIILAGKMVALWGGAFWLRGHNPLNSLGSTRHVAQALTSGIGSSLVSYAYIFAPASIIMSAKRSLSILAAIISGHYYFQETHLLEKLATFAVITAGIVLISL